MKILKNRGMPVWGVAIHQTGSGIVDLAKRHGVSPLEKAVAFYVDPDNYSAHYVIGYGGEIVQISPEDSKAMHIGFPAGQRVAFLNGSWEDEVSPATVAAWHARWPGYKCPASLFPGPSPNAAYVGIEMIPIDGEKPFFEGALYTEEQHYAVIALARDIAARNVLPVGWERAGRLVGHEDVNPISRHTKSGGWDPGGLRTKPWLDWDYIRKGIAGNGV